MEKLRLLYIYTFLQEIWICNQNLKIPITSIWPFHRISWPLTPLPDNINSTKDFVEKFLDLVLSEFLQIWTEHQNHGFPGRSNAEAQPKIVRAYKKKCVQKNEFSSHKL